MNPIQAVSPDDQNVVEFGESPGRRLRVQRQSKGLEIARVASQLHLRPSLVEALEHDRYEDLPGPVFVAGYLRSYARLLGLDPDPIVSAYRAANPSQEPPAPRVVRRTKTEIGSGHILVRLISLALIVGVIATLALWWQNRAELLSEPDSLGESPELALSPQPETPAGEPGAPAESANGDTSSSRDSLTTASTDAQPERAAAPVAAPGIPPSSTADELEPPTRGMGTTDNAAAPSPAPTLATNAAGETTAEAAGLEPAAPASNEVVLAFSGPCWIDVRDATGKVVLVGEMHKGDQRVLEGQPPYSFVIGNATATSLTVGGNPFDLQGRSRGNVARFKLNPEAAE